MKHEKLIRKYMHFLSDDSWNWRKTGLPYCEIPYIIEEALKQANHPKGWQCPVCGTVNSPYVTTCTCPPQIKTITSNTTTQ
jgi:hypothetical protein